MYGCDGKKYLNIYSIIWLFSVKVHPSSLGYKIQKWIVVSKSDILSMYV